VSLALNPPANVWQPSGLRPFGQSVALFVVNLERGTHQFVAFVFVDLRFHKLAMISVD
jgi:hypothetical protein